MSREGARRQAAYFDTKLDEEFELSRPHGQPRLYRWLLGEKVRRAVDGLALRDVSVLVVCAGSGMEGEMLARMGARVVASDISPGAVHRAEERSRRYGIDLSPIVGDAERLPFEDRSFDVVFVHDGLHHLEDPFLGLGEMARVARRAVSVSEPARAAVTAAAVRFGFALEREEAGNRVARLDPREVARELEGHGFRVVRAERYGMYYKHQPGRAVRLLSAPGLFEVTRAGFRLANAVGGRFGNKLVVIAVRE